MQSLGTVLIETLWNVKVSQRIKCFSCFFVLIETLWNVKTVFLQGHRVLYPVLIETLWNVKQFNQFVSFVMHSGINRNIVECKGTYPFGLSLT